MKVKTKDLIGAQLDWAVAQAEGINFAEHGWKPVNVFLGARVGGSHRYSTEWAQGGPIIERHLTRVSKNMGGSFSGHVRHEMAHPLTTHKVLAGFTNAHGPTLLIAAMRCYCCSKLGDIIDVPEELCQSQNS